jgi:GTP-binding protein EngB required for normal cell division
MNDNITSIITLGETGTGKSSFCNALFKSPKCQIGEDLNSQTDKIAGNMGDDLYSDIFIIDTPGLNDSKGKEADKENVIKMNSYIRENQRIKGIIILLKFTDNRLTGSIKNSIKIFSDLFPINNFWSHVVIVFSHYGLVNENERETRKNSLINNYKNEFINIMNESKKDHPNFILVDSIPMYFCELKHSDEKTKQEITNVINFLRNKEPMFKSINEVIEEPKIIKSEKNGNVTINEFNIEKIIIYTDFDDSKIETRKVIDSWIEKDIEEKINEMNEIVEENKIIKKFFDFKKIIHIDRNNQKTEKIDKENPLDSWIETQETITLPEEVNTTVEELPNNNTKITFNHKIFKQIVYTDRNGNKTLNKDKELIDEWNTYEETANDEDKIEESGNVKLIKHFKKKIKTDRNGEKKEEEPYFVNEDRVEKKVEVREIHHHHHHSGGGGCFIIM